MFDEISRTLDEVDECGYDKINNIYVELYKKDKDKYRIILEKKALICKGRENTYNIIKSLLCSKGNFND